MRRPVDYWGIRTEDLVLSEGQHRAGTPTGPGGLSK
jgi:hypothetical protein